MCSHLSSIESTMAPLPTIYTLEEIESVLSDPQFAIKLIDAIQEGFVAYSRGQFNAAPIQTLGAPPMAPFVNSDNYSAQTCVKSGYITGGDHYVIKIASGGNPHPNSGQVRYFNVMTIIRNQMDHNNIISHITNRCNFIHKRQEKSRFCCWMMDC
jgi:ornithine cyclodeaminase/alanine dehydrogenase-like protein (mu-crystallin family)